MAVEGVEEYLTELHGIMSQINAFMDHCVAGLEAASLEQLGARQHE